MNRKFIWTLLLLINSSVILGADEDPLTNYGKFAPEEKDRFEPNTSIGVEDVLPSPPRPRKTIAKETLLPSPERPPQKRSPFGLREPRKQKASKAPSFSSPAATFPTPRHSAPVSPETLQESLGDILKELSALYKEAITEGVKIDAEKITAKERLERRKKSLESGLIAIKDINEEKTRIHKNIDRVLVERSNNTAMPFVFTKQSPNKNATFTDEEALEEIYAYNPTQREYIDMHGTHQKDYATGKSKTDSDGILIPCAWYARLIRSYSLETIEE